MKDMPNPEEIQRKLSEFLKREFGSDVDVQQSAPQGTKEDMSATKPHEKKLNFDLKPLDLEAYLNKYVIGQQRAIEILATKICTHFNRMRLEQDNPELETIQGNIKSNIMMIGPTGVGKTYIVKLIADYIGVPFVKGDATKFTETGYVGGDVEDLVRQLYYAADRNLELAEMGIIYLDEIDKIASSGNRTGPDVSRTGVQRNLLKLMEESEVDIRTPHDLASQMEAMMQAQQTGKVERKKINTRNILFIVSGAFNGLGELIGKRLNKNVIGFQTEEIKKRDYNEELLNQVRTDDLVKYGFESEFVGRLPVVTVLNDLDVEALYQILKAPTSAVTQGKQRDFDAYGISIEFTDEAFRHIAELSLEDKTGARALTSTMEKILMGFEKTLPSSSIQHLTVTEEVVTDPNRQLHLLLDNDGVARFVEHFKSKYDISLIFTEDAHKTLADMAVARKMPSELLCRELFQNYEYGLKLINQTTFEVTPTVLQNPKEYLDELIKKSYEEGKRSSENPTQSDLN